MCGENVGIITYKGQTVGSPPRVRGKPCDNLRGFLEWGITPACAGKTFIGRCWRRKYQDHPRVCGENRNALQCKCNMLGSPPRVRGKLRFDSHSINNARITPACAGKTDFSLCGSSVCQDHPRVCGENALVSGELNAGLGSPPRVRGKHYISEGDVYRLRITPACAGKTRNTASPSSSPRDHPRVCGENL